MRCHSDGRFVAPPFLALPRKALAAEPEKLKKPKKPRVVEEAAWSLSFSRMVTGHTRLSK